MLPHRSCLKTSKKFNEKGFYVKKKTLKVDRLKRTKETNVERYISLFSVKDPFSHYKYSGPISLS